MEALKKRLSDISCELNYIKEALTTVSEDKYRNLTKEKFDEMFSGLFGQSQRQPQPIPPIGEVHAKNED